MLRMNAMDWSCGEIEQIPGKMPHKLRRHLPEHDVVIRTGALEGC